MLIKLKNLRLRTIVGVNNWERTQAQEVVLNIAMEFDGSAAAASDNIADTIDYKALKHRIMDAVEGSSFYLLERLAARVIEVIKSDPKVNWASVEIDKVGALRFCDSVSVTETFKRR